MNLLDLVAKISLDSSEYEEGLSQASGKIKGFSGVAAMAFGAFQQVGMSAVNSVFRSISSNMDGAIQRFDTLNRFPNVMKSLGIEGADKAIDDLADGIAKLPTTLDAVASQAQQIVPIVGDMDKAKDITLALNNALAAGGVSGAEMEGAITQWTQAMAKGKPDFTEWMRLVQAAPAQMDQLAKYMMGADAGQRDLYEAMKDGKVSIEEVNDAMVTLSKEGADGITKWSEQAEQASAGIQMSTLNVKAAMQRNIANVITAIDERFGDNGIAAKIQSIADVIDKVGGAVQGLVSGKLSIADILTFDPSNIIAGIDNMLPTFIEKGLEMAEGFTASFREGFGNLVSSGLEIVEHIAQGIATAMPSIVEKLPAIISNIAGLINDNAPKLLATGMRIILTLGQGIIQAFPTILANFPQILKAIWDVITAFNWLALGKQIITGIGKGIKAVSKSLPAALKRAGNAAKNSLKNVDWKSAGKNAIKLIATAAKAAGSMLKTALVSLGRSALNAAKNINWRSLGVNIVKGMIRGVTAMAGAFGRAIVKLVSSGLKKGEQKAEVNSPSKLFARELGMPIGEGMAYGIEKSTPLATKAVNDMLDEMASAEPFALSTTIPDSFINGSNVVQEEFAFELGSQLAELGEYIKVGMAEAVEGITITLDKRAFGKATRKAVGAV